MIHIVCIYIYRTPYEYMIYDIYIYNEYDITLNGMIHMNIYIYHIRLQSWIIPWSPYETSSTAPQFWPFSSNTLVGSARAVRLGPNARTPPSPWPQDQTSGAGRTQGKPLLFIPKPQGLNHEILKSFQSFPSMTGIEGEGKAERLRFGTWNIPSPQLKLLLWSGEWTIWVIWVYLDKSPNPPTHHLVGK